MFTGLVLVCWISYFSSNDTETRKLQGCDVVSHTYQGNGSLQNVFATTNILG